MCNAHWKNSQVVIRRPMRIPRVSFRLLTATMAVLSALATQRVGAQTGVVHGAVVDGATHARIPGARVSVVGTDLSAISGADGAYRITGVPEGDHILEATVPGFQAGSSGCVRVPDAGGGIAIPILPVGYVPPPPRPRGNGHGEPRFPRLLVVNGLRYPQGYVGPPVAPEQIVSMQIVIFQRYSTCSPNGGAILIETRRPTS
jgi:hypothetical protein